MDETRLEVLQGAADDWINERFPLGTFDPERQPKIDITPSNSVKQIAAAVSPDCSCRLVKAAMDAAKKEICLYIYNASAEHLLDLLRQAKNRQVRIRLMYDVTDTRGGERAKLASLGVELKEAPSSNGRKVFTVCHQKFAVVDESFLLIGSANWAQTSIPLITSLHQFKKGNREWLVRIDEPLLAKWFHGLFEADWNIPEMERPQGLIQEPDLRPESTFLPSHLAQMPEKGPCRVYCLYAETDRGH